MLRASEDVQPLARLLARNSLSSRLVIWLFVAISVTAVAISIIFYWATSRGLQWADDQILEKRLHIIRDFVQVPEPDPGSIDHEVSEEMEGPRQILIRVLAPPSRTLHETPNMSDSLPIEAFPDVTKAPLDQTVETDIAGSDGRRFRAVVARVRSTASLGATEVVIQIGTDVHLDEQVLAWYRNVLLVVVGGCVTLAAIAGLLIVREELRALRRITTATSGIESSNLSYRLPLEGLPLELSDLGSQFNNMLSRLERAYDGLRHYADDVAHELRTPLNKMLLGSEIALRKARTVEEYREAIESNVEECESLSRLVRGLLFVARADNTQAMIERKDVDVVRELEGIRDYFESGASDVGVGLALDTSGPINANLDRLLFQRAVANLVSNALSHTPKGGSVRIVARQDQGTTVVGVRDSGEGISEAHQAHVFDRFYRADEARSGDERIGLGLAITKSIVELHGGTITLESTPAQGTYFEIRLPPTPNGAPTTAEHDNALRQM